MLKRVLWILVLLVVAVAVFFAAQPKPVRVDLATVGRGDVRSFVEEEGKTRVVDRFYVATPVAGRMARVTLREGDPVKKGDVVARIDPIALRGELERAEAQIRALKERIAGAETLPPKPEELQAAKVSEESAELAYKRASFDVEQADAAYVQARKEAERARGLVETASSTESEVDRAEAEEVQARAALDSAKVRYKMAELARQSATLNRKVLETKVRDYEWQKRDYAQQIAAIEATLPSLRDDMKRTEILAPTNGVVLNLIEESERVLAPGAPILEVGDLDKMEVEAEFLSEDAAHMRIGMPAEIFGRALGDRVAPARIKRIFPSAFKKISSLGVEQQRVIVVVDFDNRDFKLGDRFRVEVRVILDEKKDVLLVPEGAIFRQSEDWHAFKAVGNVAVLTALRTGLRDGRMREVLDGLSAGDTVILHPGEELSEGDKIVSLPNGE